MQNASISAFTKLSHCEAAAAAGPNGLMPSRKLAMILSSRNATVAVGPPCSSVGFVGIGKTGSLFMQTVLELWAHEQLLPTVQPQQPCAVGARMGWHHASALLWRRAFGQAWNKAFTFALVRNPWARLVSHWAFHIGSKTPLDGGHLMPSQRQEARLNETRSITHFRSWVRYASQVYPPGAREAWRFTTADAHGNEQVHGFNASQLSWLVDERGSLLVNEIYRLEELEVKWPELQARVCGLRKVSYGLARSHPLVRQFDHPSSHRPFEEYYDEATSRIVADYMGPDIRYFGYSPPLLRAAGGK